MKKVKRISVIILAVIFLSSFFAIPVHAIDPLSATAIANGFAQAITAYGAANGVSLTFDGIESGNTDQIGENIHELWSRFRANQQTTDDYLAIGEALMPSLFFKAEKAAGNAAIGISIAQQYMPDIDAFWNWLLSGPAEMVKVDNAYQWSTDPNTNTITPISVYHGFNLNGIALARENLYEYTNGNYNFQIAVNSGFTNCVYSYYTTKNGRTYYVFASVIPGSYPCSIRKNFKGGEWGDWDTTVDINNGTYTVNDVTYWYSYKASSSGLTIPGIPYAALVEDHWQPEYVLGFGNAVTTPTETGVSVQPYVGDAVAKPIPIPDTTDPDYGPISWTGDLDIPWNDTLFGDGTGTLTNEQIGDIIGTIDQVIVANPDKTIELEADQDIPVNPDTPAPSEIIIPFLPVTVPSFNFSLSGIWHYVREWVTSLGSWFSLVFTVWGILPYALVVPVYATAVIVIVLGVYKRFFM